MAEGEGSTVTLPGIGKIPKWGVYALVIGGAGVAYLVYRNYESNKASAAAAATATPAPTSPAAGGTAASSVSIDPATGYPYGSPEDTAALASQSAEYGSVGVAGSIDPSTGLPYGSPEDEAALAQMYSGESVVSGYGEIPTAGQPAGETSITTNAQWDQAALANLTSLGYNEQAAATALATYLAGMPVNSTQAQMVQVALAETGNPPVGSFNVTVTGGGTSTSPTGGTTGTTGTAVNVPNLALEPYIAVPNVERMSVAQAEQTLTAAGFAYSVSGTGPTVLSQTPGSGNKAPRGSTIDLGA